MSRQPEDETTPGSVIVCGGPSPWYGLSPAPYSTSKMRRRIRRRIARGLYVEPYERRIVERHGDELLALETLSRLADEELALG